MILWSPAQPTVNSMITGKDTACIPDQLTKLVQSLKINLELIKWESNNDLKEFVVLEFTM